MTYKTIKILSESGMEILELAEVKEFLRISSTESDAMLARLILTARKFAENFCNITLVEKTYLITYLQVEQIFELPYQPVIAINKIEVFYRGNYIAVVDFFFNQNTQILYINSLPSTYNCIEITYHAKFDSLQNNYNSFKNALLMHVNLLYKKRLPESKMLAEIQELYIGIRKIRI